MRLSCVFLTPASSRRFLRSEAVDGGSNNDWNRRGMRSVSIEKGIADERERNTDKRDRSLRGLRARER